MNYLGFDIETFPFSQYDRAPKPVCVQLQESVGPPEIFKRADAGAILRSCLNPLSKFTWIGCSLRYDFACAIREWPDLATSVFELYEQGLVIDVGVYAKFLMLGRFGCVDSRTLPSGSSERLSYSLGAIARRQLGIELAGKGEDEENSWRLRFGELDDIPLERWPGEAVDYAQKDVGVLLPILESQLQEAEQHGVPLQAARLTAAADFGLYLMTCQGVDIDPVERERVEGWIRSELTDERLEPLYLSGILRRPQPRRPYQNQIARVHQLMAEGVTDLGAMAERGVRFTEAKPASVDTKLLKQIVAETAAAHGVELKMTAGGKEGLNPQISTADEFILELEHHDVRLAAYAHRQRLGKIFGTELPRIRYPRVHPNYDALKETGRTSSWDPNIQNVDPRVRACYVPPPGWLFISVDYAAIELVTLAQKLLGLFGKSTLAQLINEGGDPHAYLGARIAYEFDRANFEKQRSKLEGGHILEGSSTEEMLYLKFLQFKKGDDEQRAYFKHFRTLAKPTGLGYPGGLGPQTFVTFAKSTYGVIITLEQATALREIWHATYPEMREYFRWVSTECAAGEDDYAYTSPAGMLRNHCSYCACANGAALQTPAAEGGKLALWRIVRKCFDPSLRSLLYGCRPWGWIHDQIILSAPDDGFCPERAGEVSADMISSMRQVIPDVAVRTEACLMSKWSKEAEPKFDAQGRLVPWN